MMTIKEAQEMDLSAYLRSLGLMPQRISGNSYWFYSPFRDEQKPSFMINRTMNFWYDFGTGHGRNVIDFGVLYFQCSVGDFLRRLDSQSAGITKRIETTYNKPGKGNFKTTIDLISVSKITSLLYSNISTKEEYTRQFPTNICKKSLIKTMVKFTGRWALKMTSAAMN